MAEEISDLVVLYVDDDGSIRRMVQAIGNIYGVRVMTAGSGNEGIDIYNSNHNIDGVITDWEIPNGNGEVVTRHIKNNPRNTTLVVYSSLPEGDIHRAFSGDNDPNLLPDAVVQKSGPPVEVIKSIFDYFQQVKLNPENPLPYQPPSPSQS